jgi:Holliday junction resolvase RusA-like endonuclease
LAPVPAARARVTRWSTYFPARYAKFKETMYRDLIIVRHREKLTPADGLLYVKITFWVEMPKSWSKKKRAELDGKYAANNCDIDNYIKAVLDSCEGFYFENDRQVVMICGIKKYAEVGRIEYEQSPIEALS